MKETERTRTISWPGDPAALNPENVDFGAVAHVLGNTCCWGGRTRRFYSLAQHALTVLDTAQSLGGMNEAQARTLGLHALLADAWRAWFPDSPPRDAPAKALERHARERAAVQRAVLEAAGVETALPDSWAQVLDLTRRMAEATELRDLSDAGIDWDASGSGPLFPPHGKRIRPLRPERAAERWLQVFGELTVDAWRAREEETPASESGGT